MWVVSLTGELYSIGSRAWQATSTNVCHNYLAGHSQRVYVQEWPWHTCKDAVIGGRLLVPKLHCGGIPGLFYLPADALPELFGVGIADLDVGSPFQLILA